MIPQPLPVLDAKGNLTGILTDRDLFSDQISDEDAAKKLGVDDSKLIGLRNVLPLFYTATESYYNNAKTVKDYMIPKPHTVFRKTTLNEVARIMLSNDFGQVPVRGTKDELIGMIYDVDVLRAITGAMN
jgi:CBS domain-containing protein